MIYLDAAASSLKSKSVINAEIDFLQNKYANSGRGVCERASNVDKMVADVREKTAKFIGAKSPDQIVFTSGTTDGMNRIVNILKISKVFDKNSLVVVSDLDHHSSRMPWEESVHNGDIKFDLCPLDSNLNIDISKVNKVDIFVITAMSNVLGVPQDVNNLIAKAKQINPNVITIVDAAQYVAYLPINVSEWDCDFLCFSGHKIGSDTGIGIMYIKNPDKYFPDKFGGGMVSKITGSLKTNDSNWILMGSPEKFEAGTLPLTQIVGLSVAIDELKPHGRPDVIKYLYDELSKIPEIKIITSPDSMLLTFTVDGMHVLDFGTLIGAYGVCLRVGNMCASWLHNQIGCLGTIRISAGPWNTIGEAVEVVSIIKKIIKGI